MQEVDFELRSGEIHGLVGENGAGKSTLMKILAGVFPPDSGSLELGGKPVYVQDPKHAYDLGIRIVHQELSLVPTLTVAENLFLHEFSRHYLGWLKRKKLFSRAEKLLREWDLGVSPAARIEHLPVGKRQLVEIVRELYRQGRILILDEPTSSLTSREIDRLFRVLRGLKERGVSIIFISHRLDEIFEISDTVTVLRNGRRVATVPVHDLEVVQVITLMLGREVQSLFPKRDWPAGEVLLSVRALRGKGFSNISFDLCEGEILGIAGLMGAGRSELLRSLFGLNPVYSGSIGMNGKPAKIKQPRDATSLGLALLSESRIDEGIFPDLSVGRNVILMKLKEVTTGGWLRSRRIRDEVHRLLDRLSVASYDPLRQSLKQLSGGNQQKVLLGRLIGANPRILLLDEPTRGVDVGTKVEIHQIMSDLAREGKAIIMVSSDVSELIGLCDRILVLREGRMAGEFARAAATEEAIVRCSMGVG